MAAGSLHAADALLPSGWARDVLIEWDADGCIAGVRPHAEWDQASGIPRAAGPVLPGMPNLHSHAFQRVFAGLTEYRSTAADSFWSWRELMYRVAGRVTPGQLEAIATWLYLEMLEGGYTSVCEFHYLHNDAGGQPYADDATMALALLRAAARVGIGITLLPVLYQHGGFGGAPPTDGQRRFLRSPASLLHLADRLRRECAGPGARLGLAIHSLRAVTPEAMRDVLQGFARIDAAAPIHLHVAEQPREVEECLAWSGQRPVEWLMNHAPVDARWCLVHATHMTAAEAQRVAAAGAVVGLCPTTEANLGDGTFDLPAWTAAGSGRACRWGVGSDSHITVNAAEELRMLEYSQRLMRCGRIIGASVAQPHVATALTLIAVSGGATASGRALGGLAVGERADLVVLDAANPLIAGLAAPEALDAHVFASHRRSAIAAVIAGGRTVVEDGRHRDWDAAAGGFVGARTALVAAL